MVYERKSIWVFLVLSTACGGSVNETDSGSEADARTAEEEAICSARDEELLEQHAVWQSADNAFGALAGTRWVGIFGQPGNPRNPLDIELEVVSATEGTLQVGPRVDDPPADEGMLEFPPDGSLLEPLYYSGTYELRGAALEGDELTAFIPLSSPFENWCGLQTSYALGPTDPYYCEFSTLPDETLVIGIEGSSCHFEPSMKVVDCAWYQQSLNHCVCTSSACFANVVFPVLREWETYEDYAADGLAIRLTLDAEQNVLSGVGLWEESEYYVELTRE